MTTLVGVAAAAAMLSPLMASAEKRKLQAMIDSVKQIADRYPAVRDELSEGIRETCNEISHLLRENEDVAVLQRAFIRALQELLVDSADVPLGEEAFLGSDGHCYSKETIAIYKVSGDRLRGITPTGALTGAEGFSVRPHPIVREISAWMRFHHIAIEIAPHLARLHRDLIREEAVGEVLYVGGGGAYEAARRAELAAGTGEPHFAGGAAAGYAAARGGAGTGEVDVESDDDLEVRMEDLLERQLERGIAAEEAAAHALVAAAEEAIDPAEQERARRLEELLARHAARDAEDAAQEALDEAARLELHVRMAAFAGEGLAIIEVEQEALAVDITGQIDEVREENAQLLAAMHERLGGLNAELDELNETIAEETAFLNRVSASVTELERQQAETRRALAELEKKRKERKKKELLNTIITVAVVVGCAIATWYMGGTNLPFLVKMIPSTIGATVGITMGSKGQHEKAKEQSKDPGSNPGGRR